MNKNYKDSIPDWVPPALVKDWRQMLRSPLFMLGLLAMCLLSLLFLVPMREGMDRFSYGPFIMLGTLVLCVMVPARVGMMVETETRNPGTNFIRLTPLSSWQVVRGIWLSGAVQVVLLALLVLPLVALRVRMAPQPMMLDHAVWHLMLLVLLVVQGWTAVALAQATVALPAVLRVVGLLVLLSVVSGVDSSMLNHLQDGTKDFLLVFVVVLVAHGVMLLTLLAEARRQYAHPAERCMTAVRGCSALALVVYALVLLLVWLGLPQEVAAGRTMLEQTGTWAMGFVLLVAVWNVLHPVGGSHRGLLISGSSGLWGGVVWLTVAVGLCVLLSVAEALASHGHLESTMPWGRIRPLEETLLLQGYTWLTVLTGLLAALLVSQLSRRHSATLFVVVLLIGLIMGLSADSGLGVAAMLPIPCWKYVVERMGLSIGLADGMQQIMVLFSGVQLVWLGMLLGGFYFITHRK